MFVYNNSQFRVQRYYFFFKYANIFDKKNFFYNQYCIYGFFFVLLQQIIVKS